ncbi:MAG: Lrp/AsnC family transcriptional regulator [Desulfobacteraceae bacterium]|nr:MAG: Lrp/AsnC family transcriptional regulator [Desulfobacteraceae bacterium]
MLTPIEKKVIAALQGDIPVTEQPFLELARKLSISEDEFLNIVNDLNERGIIRRFGATIKHQKSGFKANAMVAWKVDESEVESVGRVMATFQEITHCYRRNPAPGWEYNMYTMVHAANEAECYEAVNRISKAVNQDNYTLLFSKKELKKTSMKYFED